MGSLVMSNCVLNFAIASCAVIDDVCTAPASIPMNGGYKRACRQVAYGICQGRISQEIRSYCPQEMPDTRGLANLQNKCRSYVDDMTNNEDDIELYDTIM